MQGIVSFCVLCLVVFQTINVASVISLEQTPDDEIKRLPTARRLRAPLMGRSITTVANDDNNLVQKEPNGIINSDEHEIIDLDKRRYSLPFLSRRRWMTLKRRGPLFG